MNEKKEILVTYKVDGVEIKLTPTIVQKFIVGSNEEITLPEFKFFTEMCKARGLNPFLREAYCIKYKGSPAQLIVSKDALLKRAVLDPRFDGIESGVIVLNQNGDVTERKGTFRLPNETLVGGWARVFRKDWGHPTYCSVCLEECIQRKKDGTVNSMWATKSGMMVEKVAKSRALRESFVERLGGMYEAEEFDIELPDIQKQPEPQSETPSEYNEPPKEAIETVSLNDI